MYKSVISVETHIIMYNLLTTLRLKQTSKPRFHLLVDICTVTFSSINYLGLPHEIV